MATQNRKVEMETEKIEKFSNACIASFAKVRPDWSPPHKTIYKIARSMGFTATVDGMTEKEFDKNWDRLFEAGELEGEKTRVVLAAAGAKTKLVFASEDLRHLKRVK